MPIYEEKVVKDIITSVMYNLEKDIGTNKLRASVVKKISIIAVLVIASTFILFLATNNSSSNIDNHSSSAVVTNPYEISLTQIDKNIQSGSLIIDVRTPKEYATQHAKGAINLPLTDIQKGKTPAAANDTVLYVYCHSGARAAQAKILLEKDGYQRVISLGGIGKWVALGGQVITSSKCKNTDYSRC